MGNISITITTIMLCSLATAIPGSHSEVLTMPGSHSRPEQEPAVEGWFQSLSPPKQKLHFFVQDIVSGPNQTVWKVADSATSASSPSHFGTISMADNLLTAGPEPDSEVLGRAQGTIAFADLHDVAIEMVVSIVLTEGEYKGSTIDLIGRNMLSEKEREVPIVGGTGRFRLARGVAVTNTYSSFDRHRSYEVLEYTLYVTY